MDLGITAIDVDPRCTVEDRNLFSHRRDARPDVWRRWCGWNDRLGNHREVELADALTVVRERLARAAEAAGRNATKLNCCRLRNSFRQPMYYFVAFGLSRFRRIARTRSGR